MVPDGYGCLDNTHSSRATSPFTAYATSSLPDEPRRAVNGFVATYFPNRVRATALGVTLGVGRIGAVLAISGGGVLVAAALGTFVNFSVWSIAAVVGVAAVLLVPPADRVRAAAPGGEQAGDVDEPEASGMVH